ncbi:hypothetical protein RDWZM_003611 [Blomia tropicalis]|uniref:Sodium-dependent multivitamin transporter n=1 Tax=Blomia tropicalis TaxID=40697 RepID=A0A9Q0RSR2_BLOTA|nr:hypothetical protein RDWZM_003611 [Blomia tropicalis]
MDTNANTNLMPIYQLGIADYAIFVLMLLISVSIGIYYKMTGGRQRTTAEYLLADGSMGIFPVAFSLMASFMSAITLLGVSAEIYTYGSQFMYLEMRFNRPVRIVASSVFMVQMIFYMSIVLYAPALALSAVTGTSKWVSIISVGAVCTIYCTIGGMKAVLWTDVFQSILMFTAMIIIIVKGSIDVGGFYNVIERAKNGSRLEFDNFDLDLRTRHTVWNLSIGGIFIYVSLYGTNQTQIQRLLTVNTLTKSQISLFLSWILTSLLSIVTALTGLVIYANYWQSDPLKCRYITKPDQLLPYYTVNKLSEYPGVPGLIIAGIFSGSLSTVSSFVNSLSAVTLEDYIKPLFKRSSMFQSNEILITKLLAFFYGCLCISLTYVADKMAGLLQASLTLFGVVGGPLLMLFTAGVCFRTTNSIGAMSGFVISLLFGLWIGFGGLLYGKRTSPLPISDEQCRLNGTSSQIIPFFKPNNQTIPSSSWPYIYDLSYMWFAAFSWLFGLVISLLVSFITNTKSSNHPKNLDVIMKKNSPNETHQSISLMNEPKIVEENETDC